MRNFTAPLLPMSLVFSLYAGKWPSGGRRLHMLLDAAEISHSRVYSVRTPVLTVLAGLQSNSSTSNLPGTHFCPKPLLGHHDMECLGVLQAWVMV